MNDEIKKILDYLKNDKWDYYPSDGIPYKVFLCEERDILLDYITNLQEENEFLKLNNPEMNIEHFRIVKENKRKIDNLRKENEKLKTTLKGTTHCFDEEEHKKLQQENERLKKENTILKENAEHNDKVVDKTRWNEMIYKSRCEKAIEKLESIRIFGLRFGKTLFSTLINETIDILNGGDE